jgi:hypothetical protein
MFGTDKNRNAIWQDVGKPTTSVATLVIAMLPKDIEFFAGEHPDGI